MTELKTLKDLEFGMHFGGELTQFIRKDKLKQEAIRHHKAIVEKKSRWNRQDVLNWIDYFFNITDEDLK